MGSHATLIEQFGPLFRAELSRVASVADPAHDLLHFERVARTATLLCVEEDADAEIVIPAAWLHDLVIVAKDDPRRSQASRLSAAAAVIFLREVEYPSRHYDAIAHAIEAHSFSANIEPQTLEAKIVQDADRLDGIGAIGVARCFATAGLLKRPFYSVEDPFCDLRAPDDRHYTVDHFYAKLFKTAASLQTESARNLGLTRVQTMRDYLDALRREIQ